MSLTFADTHNMVAFLNKSDASEGLNQVIDFLNGSHIKYALTVNPNIYLSCIKQFWNTVVVKQTNDIIRLQALVDRKKVVITKAAIRDVLRLGDAEGVDCLPNEEIFSELARMGYEKPSTKLTFYKAFFSSQWKVGKGFLRVETPLFDGMLVAGVIELEGDAEEQVQDVVDDAAAQGADTAYDKVAQALEITKLKRRVKKLEKGNKVKVLKLRRLKKVGTSQRIDTSEDTVMKDASNHGRMIDDLDKDDVVSLMDDKEEEKKEEEVKDDQV
nr:xylulose kinase-1 [Tanacetum cinerariifolium]